VLCNLARGDNITLASSRRLLVRRYRQIRSSRAGNWVDDGSTRNLSLVIYVFGALEMGRIVAFEIVEVCGVDTVIPNNGTTINLVRVA
jgi:hypothetical protein